jgi:hypothetical protein
MEHASLQTFVFATRVGKVSFVKLEYAPFVSMGFVQRPSSVSVFTVMKGRAATSQSVYRLVTTVSLSNQMFANVIQAFKVEFVISQSAISTVAPRVIASPQIHASVTSVGKAVTQVHLAILLIRYLWTQIVLKRTLTIIAQLAITNFT